MLYMNSTVLFQHAIAINAVNRAITVTITVASNTAITYRLVIMTVYSQLNQNDIAEEIY